MPHTEDKLLGTESKLNRKRIEGKKKEGPDKGR